MLRPVLSASLGCHGEDRVGCVSGQRPRGAGGQVESLQRGPSRARAVTWGSLAPGEASVVGDGGRPGSGGAGGAERGRARAGVAGGHSRSR